MSKIKSVKIFKGSLIGFFFLLILFGSSQISAVGNTPSQPSSQPVGQEGLKLPEFVFSIYENLMFMGFFIAFLSLIIAGALWFLSPISVGAKSAAKDRFSGAVSGVLILAFAYLIITTINPQLKIFSTTPQAPAEEIIIPEPAGVYFYQNKTCQNDTSTQSYSASLQDMGTYKNKFNSIAIHHDSENGEALISIVYNNPGLWGKCQYINPNSPCAELTEPFASSASIYRYDFHPTGDGVYIYRNSCLNDKAGRNNLVQYCNANSGGYKKISNGDIGSIYTGSLDTLRFTGDGGSNCTVPENEQPCIKYNQTGACTQRECPKLSGENISSLIINGDYLVILSYAGPGQTCEEEINDFCQEFPSTSDINKIGPQQIKWEKIRTGSEFLANCLTIIPIKR